MTDKEFLRNIRDQINERLNRDYNLTVYREGNRIKVESDILFDELQWEVDGNEVSVQEMIHKKFKPAPPNLPAKEYYIGNSDNINKEFKITIGTGYWNGDKYILEDSETISLPAIKEQEPIDTSSLLVSLWDSWNNGYNDFDVVKLERWTDLQEQYNKGKTVILSASHTWKEEVGGETVLEPEYKWKSRLQRLADIVKDLDPNRYLIFLQDEPLGKKHWSLSDLNRLIGLAKDILPKEARIGMSFTNGSVLNKELPQGLNLYLTPNYEFKTEWAIAEGHKAIYTKQEYDEVTDSIISTLREKVGDDKEIYLIGQGFYNTGSGDDKPHEKRWRKPPVEYPQWLYEACVRNNIQGVWWWLLKVYLDHYKSLNEMPEVYEEILNKT